MPSRSLQRDSRGRFSRSIQPETEQPIEPPQPEDQLDQLPQNEPPPQAAQPLEYLQRAVIALSTPLANLASAFRSTLPGATRPATSQTEPPNIPAPRYVPPPRYVTDSPLPRPDFNAPGSSESLPRESTPFRPDQPEVSDNFLQQQVRDITDNDMSSSKDG